MARLLAIEWDDREARVAVATPRGSEIVVEEAFAIDLSAVAADDATDNVQAVGQRIAEALAQRGLTGSEALVGLGRASIELRSLSLPPAPPEELPDLIRFQAMQAFSAIGENWPLDFVELGTQDDSLNVLVAVVSPTQVQQILQVCAASALKPRCLVLRPFAAASLLNRSQLLAAGRNVLVLDLLADGADLTAISQGQVVFMRTVRLPATDDAGVQARAMLGEVRRTIGAAQAQVGGKPIEQIIICGSAAEHPVLAQSLAETLSLEVVLFDPFQAVPLARPLEQQLPADAGRYAPLLGMLADDAAGVRHALDFLNPRKRPVARSHRRRNVTMAAAALATVGALTLAIWAGLKYYDRQIADLQQQAVELDKQVEAARKLMAQADAVKEFTDGDVTWLDEMWELARLIPDADHVKLSDVRLSADIKRGGVMTLKGSVKSSEVIAKFEDSLRYNGNVVAGRYGSFDKNKTDYPYLLDTTVLVVPDTYDRGRSQGRPFRDRLRKEAAEGAAKPPVAAATEPTLKPAPKPAGGSEAESGSPPGPPPAPTGGSPPAAELASPKIDPATPETEKAADQPTPTAGKEKS